MIAMKGYFQCLPYGECLYHISNFRHAIHPLFYIKFFPKHFV